jgi:hypothetical protein
MSLFKKIANRFFLAVGYSPIPAKKSRGIKSDFFKTSYPKKVLLSYIQSVFDNPQQKNDRSHTNRLTTFVIAEILSELGYQVDIINYDDTSDFECSRYDLVLGLGIPIEYALQKRNNDHSTKVVWFGTGCNPLYSNVITLKRLDDFYQRHKKLILSSTRYINQDWPLQHEFSDWILLHGSKFAKSTYSSKNISCIHAPVFIYPYAQKTDEDWVHAGQHYLWFGMGGFIHKGLDLVIDSFKSLNNCTLHICGLIESEIQFFDHYKSVLDSSVNIIYHGFVDVQSTAFQDILKKCAFIIFPSASEGNSPSVITCMANGGLIPIVTENADVDLNGYGIHIENLSVNAVTQAVEKSQKLSLDDLKKQSEIIAKETNQLNSFDYFRIDFKQKLTDALKNIQ